MYDKQSLECNLIVDDDFMNKDVFEKRLCIDRDFSLSAMFTRDARIDTLNLHIYLGKKDGKCVDDLIKLREARYLI